MTDGTGVRAMFTHQELIFLQLTERRLEQARPARPRRVRNWAARVRAGRPASRDVARAGPVAGRPAGTLAVCAASGAEAR